MTRNLLCSNWYLRPAPRGTEQHMPRPSHVVIAALTGSIASSASAQPLSDDFESYDVGSLPGTPWQDISTRIDNPTIPAPTASVINTTGADGSPTRAVQIVDERGTSSGIFADIQPADHHVFRMDVRIDQFSDVQGAWPGGIGLLQDENAADFNGDPQAVLYAWQDRRWHLFIKNSPAGAPNSSFDLLLAGLPRINVGRWYTLELEVDTQAGAFNASVFNGGNRRTHRRRLARLYELGPGVRPIRRDLCVRRRHRRRRIVRRRQHLRQSDVHPRVIDRNFRRSVGGYGRGQKAIKYEPDFTPRATRRACVSWSSHRCEAALPVRSLPSPRRGHR